jgi:hypothetical protein
VLHVSIGSRDTRSDAITGEALREPRVVPVCDLSNHVVTSDEFEAYRQRVELQAKRSGQPQLDRLPTAGEARDIARRAAELKRTAVSSSDSKSNNVEQLLSLSSKLGTISNLTLVRERTVVVIGNIQETLPTLVGDAQRKAELTLDRFMEMLRKITEEEARRKTAHLARERQRLSSGQDVSTLTNFINAKVRCNMQQNCAAAALRRDFHICGD